MENTGYIALSRQTALRRQLDAIANNMANMNTTGYRRQDVLFTDHLVRTLNTDSIFRDQVRFVEDFATINDMQQGPVRHTGNTFDVAINDPTVFLSVETPAGERFSRGGAFILDAQGQLTNQDGYPVLGDNNAPIFIAPNESQVTITENGAIITENGPVGTLKSVSFAEPEKLKRYGSTLWKAPQGLEPEAADAPKIIQGSLEGSNVNGIVEMTHLINVQRAYERSNMMIEREDQRIRRTMQMWTQRSA